MSKWKKTAWNEKSNSEHFSAASENMSLFLLIQRSSFYYTWAFFAPFSIRSFSFLFLQNNIPISISIYHAWCMIGCEIKLLSLQYFLLFIILYFGWALWTMGIGVATQNSWHKLLCKDFSLCWDSHSVLISQCQWGALFLFGITK